MTESKAWDWEKGVESYWLQPSEESYYLAEKWKQNGFHKILDLGSGLGRHAIYFAKQGFDVSALDLSDYGITHLNKWAAKESCNIQTTICDIKNLPYQDASFDCIFSYHVISHTDSVGIITIITEIERVLKPGGQLFLTLCSKETWAYKDANSPKIDENTVVKTNDGPEKDVPHFYVNMDDILHLFKHFNIEKVRHIDDCFFDNQVQNSKHFFIYANLK